MKREVYESQKAFAGEKKPSMQRRCVDFDYTQRMMYMVTMTTEGRRPLFGRVVGQLRSQTFFISSFFHFFIPSYGGWSRRSARSVLGG